jgi:cysteine desulfurase
MYEKLIYLDYNATTPVDPEVHQVMLPYLGEAFGNPSSNHPFGREARQAVDTAREQIAGLLGCQPDEIIFTSGGTESNNMAIKGFALANRKKGNHIITSQIEHPAVLEVCAYLEANGFEITRLPVDPYGMMDPDAVEAAITERTILISVMHANNEVGTIQPVAAIGEIAHRHNIAVHSDAAQSVGKIPVQVDKLGVDMLSLAGHKIYAPKGIGALYLRRGIQLEKFMHGAAHESGRRAGTENVPFIVGLGKACALIIDKLNAYTSHMQHMRDMFESAITQEFAIAHINGHPVRRLPNTASIGFKGYKANVLLSEFNRIAASAGAACHADSVDISSVLTAMKVPQDIAMGTIRFSTGRLTTAQEVKSALDEIRRIL